VEILPVGQIMFKKSIASLFLGFVLLFSAGCSENTGLDADTADGSGSFEDGVLLVNEGETISIGESGIEITFVEVVEESRCPEDVVCVTAGRAIIRLDVTYPSGQLPGLKLEIPGLVATPFTGSDSSAIPPFTLRLIELSPYPNASAPSNLLYRASLEVLH